VKVVACRQDKQVSEFLAEVVMNKVIRRCIGKHDEGSVVGVVLANMAMEEV
jgi:adenine deaminase